YGGFLWMTANGAEEKITKAKKILINGAIGLLIVLSAFSIAQFVLSRLLGAIGDGGGGGGGGQVSLEDVTLTGALGSGPITDHDPQRDATGIPPNTRIFVTFREAVDGVSFAADTNGNGLYATVGTCTDAATPTSTCDNNFDLALPQAVQVARVGVDVDWTKLTPANIDEDGNPTAAFSVEAAKLVRVGVARSSDGKTIVLTPVDVQDDGHVRAAAGGSAVRQWLAGDARTPQAYVVRLTSAIQTTGDEALFSGAFRDGYSWSFTVSADADLTPPTVTGVIPFPDNTQDGAAVADQADVPRNRIVQVQFSEAMDPTVTSGTYLQSDTTKRFAFLQTRGTDQAVDGEWALLNGYRTAEFVTFAACGQNSCGGTVFCLPGGAALSGIVESAVPENANDPNASFTAVPFSGVMDAAGNALDGNRNNHADGAGTPRFDLHPDASAAGTSDSVQWSFFTTNEINLTPPTIDEVVHIQRGSGAQQEYSASNPLTNVESVSATAPMEFQFSKLMRSNAATALLLEEVTGALVGCNPTSPDGSGCIWHYGRLAHEPTGTPMQSRVTVSHARLREPVETSPDVVPEYRVRVSSEAQDIDQNCFFSASAYPPGPQGPHGGETCVQPASGNETCAVIP
ncbi:MAG: pilin, partial [bacterium]|nr:pilin [bacterium]